MLRKLGRIQIFFIASTLYPSEIVHSTLNHGSLLMASNSTAKLFSVIGVTIVVLLLDLLSVLYATSHGLAFNSRNLSLDGFAFALQWLPFIGVALVSLVVWYEAFARLFLRRAGPEADPLAYLRLLRVIVFALAAFACLLFIPYVLGSNWFWSNLSNASRSSSQFSDFGTWLLGAEAKPTGLDAIWQYSTLQILAVGAMVIVAWIFTRQPRRLKKFR